MGKLIQFPTGEEIKQRAKAKEVRDEQEVLNEASDNCVKTSKFLLEVLEEFILTGEVGQDFMDMQFRDETFQESRDMFVIVNMINAMLHRYYAIPHNLHKEFDKLYVGIKAMDKQHSQAKEELEEEYEVLFTPDFDLKGEDDDDDDPV